jgi:hypothetical protein
MLQGEIIREDIEKSLEQKKASFVDPAESVFHV